MNPGPEQKQHLRATPPPRQFSAHFSHVTRKTSDTRSDELPRPPPPGPRRVGEGRGRGRGGRGRAVRHVARCLGVDLLFFVFLLLAPLHQDLCPARHGLCRLRLGERGGRGGGEDHPDSTDSLPVSSPTPRDGARGAAAAGGLETPAPVASGERPAPQAPGARRGHGQARAGAAVGAALGGGAPRARHRLPRRPHSPPRPGHSPGLSLKCSTALPSSSTRRQ